MSSLKLAPTPTPEGASNAAGVQTADSTNTGWRPFWRVAYWAALLLVLLIGLAARVQTTATVKGVGFDETLYQDYVLKMTKTGLGQYPLVSELYIEEQSRPGVTTQLPPTRFLYIFCGSLWKDAVYGDAPTVNLMQPGGMWQDPSLCSLRAISKLFSVLTLFVAGFFTWRMAGKGAALAVTALMAVAPLQVHMSQHAMIDGFFAFWATLTLWGLWEALRRPDKRRWLAVYGLGLACMVLTKENSFFVFVAICGLLMVNRWAHWGTITPRLLGVTFIAPAVGLALLVAVAGGVSQFIKIYTLLVSNAQHLDYAIETGDGPWYRYLVDLMVVSPLLLCLAVAAALRVGKEERWIGYILVFVGVTYLIMCNVRYGMNLRYATIWELPLCLLAFAQITWMAKRAGRWAPYLIPAIVTLLCLHQWHQYRVFFKDAALYELAPADLLHAVKILK